ncbi:MAG: Fumarate and nitrate reduction regulatory protein [Legionellaceae bacterium]
MNPISIPINNDLKLETNDVESLNHGCNKCFIKSICLPIDFNLSLINKIVKKQPIFKRKDFVFQIGQAFQGIYVIQSGTIKRYRINHHGDEEVIGFFLPGELIGFEAIHSGLHNSSAVCLSTTRTCKIELKTLLSAATENPQLQIQLLKLMSWNLALQEGIMHQRTAEQKVASFLLSLFYRYHFDEISNTEFALPMSRQDIGNYLNLAAETVSRIISQFQHIGLLTVKYKYIKLIKIKNLEKIAF